MFVCVYVFACVCVYMCAEEGRNINLVYDYNAIG